MFIRVVSIYIAGNHTWLVIRATPRRPQSWHIPVAILHHSTSAQIPFHTLPDGLTVGETLACNDRDIPRARQGPTMSLGRRTAAAATSTHVNRRRWSMAIAAATAAAARNITVSRPYDGCRRCWSLEAITAYNDVWLQYCDTQFNRRLPTF